MRRRSFLATTALLGFALGCSSRPAVKTQSDEPRIQRIAVQTFEGVGGPDMTREFLAALQASGLAVIERSQKPDAVLVGAVTSYKPGRKLIVFLGSTQTLSKDQMLTLSNPILSGSGPIVPQTAATGSSPRVVTVQAAVQLRLRLINASGAPLWDSEYSYEALNIQTARQAVIGVLSRSLKRAAPQLQQVAEPAKS